MGSQKGHTPLPKDRWRCGTKRRNIQATWKREGTSHWMSLACAPWFCGSSAQLQLTPMDRPGFAAFRYISDAYSFTKWILRQNPLRLSIGFMMIMMGLCPLFCMHTPLNRWSDNASLASCWYVCRKCGRKPRFRNWMELGYLTSSQRFPMLGSKTKY